MATQAEQGPTTGLTPHLTIRDGRAKEAIDFYTKAFAATERIRMPAQEGERLMHAHLIINGASLMLNDDFPEHDVDHSGIAPGGPGGFVLHLHVDDADAWFDRAVTAGATATMPLENMFWGDRYGQVKDPFGFTWSIATPVKA